jgi:hypothetical protein
MTEQPSLLTLLEPIDPTTLVERMPGVDAPCPRELADRCGYPFCCCYANNDQEATA